MARVRPIAHRQQDGLSLLVVMVVLALSSWLAMGAARTSWLNEQLVSTQSDHERALAAAEALLKDAENDIQGRRADGQPCSTEPAHAGCRGVRSDRQPFFPSTEADLAELRALIGTDSDCRQGICVPASVTALHPQAFAAQLLADAATGHSARGARYGQFTGTTTQNPLLGGTAAKAWYWVEVFHYDLSGPAPTPGWRAQVPDPSHPLLYRINAYAQGHKAGTRVWLRSLFVRPPPPTPPPPTPP